VAERFDANIRRLAAQGLPAVLSDFLDWLVELVEASGWEAQPFDSLQGERMDDYAGADLSSFFTFFIRMGNGDPIGVWHGAIADIEASPVVLVGHEGDYEFLGQSCLHFLARLAVDPTLRPLLVDLDIQNWVEWEPFRASLSSWLEDGRLPEGQTLAEFAGSDPRDAHPDFRAWFEAKLEEAREHRP
jgi:hypothetical protein